MGQSSDVKTAVVVGGTSGIGLALARGLVSQNIDVIAAGLEPLPGDEENIRFVALDIRDDHAVKFLFEQFDHLHALINAAGIIRRQEELEPEVFQQVIDINLTGTMRTCAAARSKLAKAGGAILNIASMLSYFGGGLVPGYSTSKGGVMQLTKSLAIAYADDDIRVNALAPGWINTPLTKDLQNDPVRNNAILGRTPMKRWGDVE
jgi:NAD(P)-dependent dehydrogenase (short-subunit alcohol dehydrogenase family)